MDRQQITFYLRGMIDGLALATTILNNSKREIGPSESDPLYAHTWNHVVGLMEEDLKRIIAATQESLPKGLPDDSDEGRTGSTGPVDQGLLTASRPPGPMPSNRRSKRRH